MTIDLPVAHLEGTQIGRSSPPPSSSLTRLPLRKSLVIAVTPSAVATLRSPSSDPIRAPSYQVFHRVSDELPVDFSASPRKGIEPWQLC